VAQGADLLDLHDDVVTWGEELGAGQADPGR